LVGTSHRIAGFFRDPIDEKPEPIHPVSGLTNIEKKPIILFAIPLEICAQVKQRLGQEAFGTEEQSDKKSAHTSIAVPKRMDGFKLIMDERKPD